MSKIGKVLNVTKSILPTAKSIVPSTSAPGKILSVAEITTVLAKPYVDNAIDKNIEKSKRIDATQKVVKGNVLISLDKVGIEVSASDEERAFKLFVESLESLRSKKVLSSNKKLRKEQVLLIDKLNSIINNEGVISEYIYRVQVSDVDNGSNKSKHKLNRLLLKRK